MSRRRAGRYNDHAPVSEQERATGWLPGLPFPPSPRRSANHRHVALRRRGCNGLCRTARSRSSRGANGRTGRPRMIDEDHILGELLALQILSMRTLALLALTQPDPNGFMRDQELEALSDVSAASTPTALDENEVRDVAKERIGVLFRAVTLHPEG
jgi:hypothetical protein